MMTSPAPTGKQLLRAAWRMLRATKGLLLLPFLGAITAILAAVIFAIPGVVLTVSSTEQWATTLGVLLILLLGALAATVATVFFQGATVSAAMQTAEGRDVTLRSSLAGAGRRFGALFSWGLLTATVGVLLSIVRDKLGSAGAVVAALGGLAWGVATYFCIPVIIAENANPIAAIRRSGALLTKTWGSAARAGLRFGFGVLLLNLLAVGVIGAGIVTVQTIGSAPLAAVLIGVGVLMLIVIAVITSAISAYAKALLYRYAMGMETPGIDATMLAGAVARG